jgi:hypothetical protein
MYKELRKASEELPGDNTTTYKTMKTPRSDIISINGYKYYRQDLECALLTSLKLKFDETVEINGNNCLTDSVAEELVHTLDKFGDCKIDIIRYEHLIELVEQVGVGNLMWYDLETLANDVFLKENENGMQIVIPEHATAAERLLEILEINTYLNPANFQNYKEEGFETIEDAMNTCLALKVVNRWRHGTKEERGRIYQFIHQNFFHEFKYTLKKNEEKTFSNFKYISNEGEEKSHSAKSK